MRKQLKSKKVRLGISVGDINGIGLEVIMKAFSDNRIFDLCTAVVYASSNYVKAYQKETGMKNIRFNFVKPNSKFISNRINLINCWEEDVNLNLGEETDNGGIYALKSLYAAVDALKKGDVDVLVTAPINKHNIQSNEFNFPGHTEYFANEFNGGEALMFMVSDSLKIGVVTGHIPIADVASSISVEKILKKVNQIDKSLKSDFNIRKPKIAVLGLNPHNGDKGVIGKEDDTIILPAIEKAFNSGKLVYGPYSADSFFASDIFTQFDAVLAMYHDQGLIPFKNMSFNRGVNFTAGISVVRTSPDHGTAYDLVGKNKAQESSFREAVYLAIKLFKNRLEYSKLNENPLKIKPISYNK
ncbi:MAG: 4-hydroxythreonine-4-phosphate dehydrogenase [Cryomorphaceae bacterium]|nr:MAG: 4-hydroxythreonine-4-phosphate dehydrogenase [Cryomorphaceae bacterium]